MKEISKYIMGTLMGVGLTNVMFHLFKETELVSALSHVTLMLFVFFMFVYMGYSMGDKEDKKKEWKK